MLKWLRSRLERRAVVPGLESTWTNALIAAASGESLNISTTGAATACAGLYGRALALARVDASPAVTGALDANTRSMAGSQLVLRGESLHLIETTGGALRLIPASEWEITGEGYDPATWIYTLTLESPSQSTIYRKVSAAQVLHLRWEESPGAPWRGCGPLESASQSLTLAARLEDSLKDEARAPRGYVIPVPANPTPPADGSDPLGGLKTGLAALKGRVTLTESTTGAWGTEAGGGVPRMADWMQRRIGFDPPKASIELRRDLERCVMAACLIPGALIDSDADAQARREAYRIWLHSAVEPLGRKLEASLSAAFDEPVRLGFDALRAADMQGRARAYRSLIGSEGGMDAAEAARITGLE